MLRKRAFFRRRAHDIKAAIAAALASTLGFHRFKRTG